MTRMVKLTNDATPTLKQVRPYNLPAMSQYLQIRYKVFIDELGRSIIGEFNTDDLIAKHYILEARYAIGTARVVYKENHIAEIGRVAILKEYRNQGYGAMLINQAIEVVKTHVQVNLIKLFTESETIEFYKKLGFIETGEVFFDNVPLITMITAINK